MTVTGWECDIPDNGGVDVEVGMQPGWSNWKKVSEMLRGKNATNSQRKASQNRHTTSHAICDRNPAYH